MNPEIEGCISDYVLKPTTISINILKVITIMINMWFQDDQLFGSSIVMLKFKLMGYKTYPAY